MSKLNKKFLTIFLTFALIFGFYGQVWAVTIDSIEIVSKSTGGTLGNEHSSYPMVSSDGRYVFFASNATNLVAGDTNANSDIFKRDLQTNITTRISVSTAGAEVNGYTTNFSITPDGHYVVFESDATTLVANDTNSTNDLFIRDTQLNTTTRLSVSTAGVESDGNSGIGGISSDGRYVSFYSDATNLVANDTNASSDIFVRDTQSNTTTRVSVSTADAQGDNSSSLSAISDDGRYVVFRSNATNLVANDTNAKNDIFIRDTQNNTTTRISVDSNGVQGDDDSYLYSYNFEYPYFAFQSYATNLVANDTNGVQDIFIHNIQTGETSRVSVSSAGVEGDADSYYGTATSDGRYVFFYSEATNLVANDTNAHTDVFVRDTQTNTTTRLSVDSNGAEVIGYSSEPYVAYSGDYLVYSSDATIVAGDTNGFTDIFLLALSYLSTPTTSTTSASSITTTTAVLTGNITATGGEANTVRGFDIGTDTSYTMSDITESGSYSTGSYSLTATGLTCNTTYHYRAYSTNTAGTGTGSDDTFTTSACPVAASTGGAVPVWILQSMSDALRNTPSTNTQTAPTPNPQPIPTPEPIPTPLETPQSKFQFTKNLKYRDRNTYVLELQKFLNTNGYIVSNTGAGSIGNETTYFGPATRNALIKFQLANNIKPAVGYFGVVTRGVVNK